MTVYVYLSACLLVTTVSPTKLAKPIEVPFAVWARVCARYHGCPDPFGEKEQCMGHHPIADYVEYLACDRILNLTQWVAAAMWSFASATW